MGLKRSLEAVAGQFAGDPGDDAAPLRPGLLYGLLALIVLVGGVLRCAHLGALGLHGDEKTMALPTLGWLEHGRPIMPSGMLYPRALGQIALMALSVRALGLSEFALRLPSALCGIALIPLAFLAGRRFLADRFAILLAAVVALLPPFIEDAQTARMYVFLVTLVTAWMAMLWAWERRGSPGWLAGATALLLLACTFHTLAIFASLMVFVPPLLNADRRRLVQAAIAFAVLLAGFWAVNAWTSAQYFEAVGPADLNALYNGPKALAQLPHPGAIAWGAGLVALLLLGWAGLLAGPTGPAASALRAGRQLAAVLMAGAVAACLTWHVHLALWLMMAGLVLGRRSGLLRSARVAAGIALLVPALALIELVSLHLATPVPLRQLAGALLGWPSVWPLAGLAWYSLGAALLVVLGSARALLQAARGEPVPAFMLLLILGVLLPILAVGCLRWDIPPRYAEAQVMPMLIGAAACAQWLLAAVRAPHRAAAVSGATAGRGAPSPERAPAMARAPALWGAVALLALVCVDPRRLGQELDAGYATHPDHVGAARFIESQRRAPDDVVVAEDSLQQTFYLGHIDYWLVNREVGSAFARNVDGQLVDIYTGAPLLGSGDALRALIARRDRGAVWIVGSGEDQSNGRALPRGSGIAQVLAAPPVRHVWRGRDGRTDVWFVPPPRLTAGLDPHPQRRR